MEPADIRHKLSQFLDNRLPVSERRGIENLINTDPVWKEEYRKILALAEMADRFALEADEKYWQERQKAVMDKIADDEAEKITEVTKPGYRVVYLKLAAVAASIALVAFISIYESQDFETTRGIFKADKAEIQAVQNMSVSPEVVSALEKDSAGIEDKAGLGKMAQGISASMDQEKARPSLNEEVNKRKVAVPIKPVQPEPPKDEGIITAESIDDLDRIKSEHDSTAVDLAGAEIDKGQLHVAEETGSSSSGVIEPTSVKVEVVTKMVAPEFDAKLEPQSGQLTVTGNSHYETIAKNDIDDSLNEYYRWRMTADSLESRYSEIVSIHYEEFVAKGRRQKTTFGSVDETQSQAAPSESVGENRRTDIPADSVLYMGHVFYQVGLLTGNDGETSMMRRRLERLAEISDSTTADSLSRLLQNLVSPQK